MDCTGLFVGKECKVRYRAIIKRTIFRDYSLNSWRLLSKFLGLNVLMLTVQEVLL